MKIKKYAWIKGIHFLEKNLLQRMLPMVQQKYLRPSAKKNHKKRYPNFNFHLSYS